MLPINTSVPKEVPVTKPDKSTGYTSPAGKLSVIASGKPEKGIIDALPLLTIPGPLKVPPYNEGTKVITELLFEQKGALRPVKLTAVFGVTVTTVATDVVLAQPFTVVVTEYEPLVVTLIDWVVAPPGDHR